MVFVPEFPLCLAELMQRLAALVLITDKEKTFMKHELKKMKFCDSAQAR